MQNTVITLAVFGFFIGLVLLLTRRSVRRGIERDEANKKAETYKAYGDILANRTDPDSDSLADRL